MKFQCDEPLRTAALIIGQIICLFVDYKLALGFFLGTIIGTFGAKFR